jgi:hypothetical protein
MEKCDTLEKRERALACRKHAMCLLHAAAADFSSDVLSHHLYLSLKATLIVSVALLEKNASFAFTSVHHRQHQAAAAAHGAELLKRYENIFRMRTRRLMKVSPARQALTAVIVP